MARNYAEFKAAMDAKKAAAAAPVAPPPAAVEPSTFAPMAPPSKSVAPAALPVTAPTKVVKAKREETPKVEPVSLPKVEAPPQPALELPPDMARPVDYRAYYDRARTLNAEGAIAPAAEALGMSAVDFKRIAEAQGVDLESIRVARKNGRSYDEIAKAARERGVMGFLPVEERKASLTKLSTDFEKATRGEAPDTLELKRAGADKGFGPAGALAGYTAAGTQAVLPDIAKPGEHGYTISAALIEALKSDPQASKIYDLYGRSMATGGTQKYIESRLEELKKRAGITPSDPQSVEKVARLRRQATNEVIAYKTVGQWTPAITLGDVDVTEGREAPSFFGALSPNIEIIGFNNKGQAIFRQESPLGVLLRAIDIPQSVTVAALEGRPVSEGVATGANFLEYALDHSEGATPLVRYPAVAAGFAASVIFPDMLLAAGKAGKVVKAGVEYNRIRKIAPEVTALLKTIAESRAAKNFEAARVAEVELRRLTPAVADQLNNYDASAAELMKLVDPMTDTASDDLTAIIGARIKAAEQEAAGRVWQHPSMRRETLSAKTDTKDVPFADYDELFSTEKLLDRVTAARQAHAQAFPKTMAEYISNYVEGATRNVLAPFAKEKGLKAADIDKLAAAARRVAPALLTSEKDFREALQAALKADDTFKTDAYTEVRKLLHVPTKGGLVPQVGRKMKDIAGQSLDDLKQADLALLDRASAAIEKNNEARAYAAAALLDEIAKRGKLRIQPINLFDDVAVLDSAGKPVRLSAAGQVFLKQLRRAMPGQNFDEAYRLAAINDQLILSQAKRQGIDPFKLYKQKFPQIMRASAADLERFGIAPKSVPPTPAPPLGSAGKKALKWKPTPVPNAKPMDIADVDQAKRLLLDARAGRFSTAAIASYGRADGTTGAYVIVMGDVRIMVDAPLDGDDFNVFVKVGATETNVPSVTGNPMQALLAGVDEAEALMKARVQKGEPAIKGAPDLLTMRRDLPETAEIPLMDIEQDALVSELDALSEELDRITRRIDGLAGTDNRATVAENFRKGALRVMRGETNIEGLRELVAARAQRLADLSRERRVPVSFGALPASARPVLPPTAAQQTVIKALLQRDPFFPMDELRGRYAEAAPASLAKLRSEAQGEISKRVRAFSTDEIRKQLDLAENAIDDLVDSVLPAADVERARRNLNGYAQILDTELSARNAPRMEATEVGLRAEREVTEAAPRVEAPEAPPVAEAPVVEAPPAAVVEAPAEAAPVVRVTPSPAAAPGATTGAPPQGVQPTWYRGFGRAEKGAAYGGEAQSPILGAGRYYATSPEAAKFYGPQVETREIRPTNPLVIRSDAQWRTLTREAGWEFPNPFGVDPKDVERWTGQLSDLLRQRGHDAVYVVLSKVGDDTRLLGKVFSESQAFVPSWADEAAAPAPVARTAELVFTEVGGVGSAKTREAERLGRESTAAPSGGPWVVAEADGKTVGAAYLGGGGDTFKFDIVVAPEAQGMGVGERLLDQVLSHYMDLAETRPGLVADVEVVSPVMKRMLERRGFAERAPRLDRLGRQETVAIGADGFSTTFMEASAKDLTRPAVSPRLVETPEIVPEMRAADADMLRRADDLSNQASTEERRALDALAKEMLPPGTPQGVARSIVAGAVDRTTHPAFAEARRLESEAADLRRRAVEAPTPSAPTVVAPATPTPISAAVEAQPAAAIIPSAVSGALNDARQRARQLVSAERPADLVKWNPDSDEFYSDWAIRSIAYDLARLDARGIEVPPDIMEDVLRGLEDAQAAKADVARLPPTPALDQAITRELKVERHVNDIKNGAEGGATASPRFTVVNSASVLGLRGLGKDDKYIVMDNWRGRPALQSSTDFRGRVVERPFAFKTRAEGQAFVAPVVEAQPTGAKIRGGTRAKAPKPEAAPVVETPEVQTINNKMAENQKKFAEAQKKSAADSAARAEAVEKARQEKSAKKLAELEAQRKIRDAEKQSRLEAYQAEQVRLAEEKAKKLAEREVKAKAKAEEAAKRLADRQAKEAEREALRAALEAQRKEEERLFVEAVRRAEAEKARKDADAAALKVAEEKRAAEVVARKMAEESARKAARDAEFEAERAARAARQAEREAEAARVAAEAQQKAAEAREALRKEMPLLANLEDRFPVSRPANLKVVLRAVNRSTTNEAYKRIIDRLLEQGGRFDGAEFQVAQAGDVVNSSVANSLSRGASGTMHTVYNDAAAPLLVHIRGTSLGKIDFPLDEVIIHEAIHAATVDQYEIGIRIGAKGTSVAAAAESINNLHGQVVSELKRRLTMVGAPFAPGSELMGFSQDDLARMVNKPTELIAYGLTNPQFQALLKTIKVESAKSAWTKFVESVARLLGLAPGDESALSALIERTERLMDLPPDELEAARRMVFPNSTPEASVSEARAATPTRAAEAAEAVEDAAPPSTFFKAVSPTGKVTGVTEFLDDGRSIIYLLEGADASTVLDGLGRVLRRNVLATEDMDDVVAWLKTRGVTVGHEFGDFTGDEAEVLKAEDLFAQAFARYVADGTAPNGTLSNAFDGLKDAAARIYRLASDPSMGVTINDGVRAAFNRAFSDVTEQTGATLKQVLRRELVGEADDQVEILDLLSREAVRRGLPKAQLADIQKKFDDALAAAKARGEKVTDNLVAIEFPVKILGKENWTVRDLAEAQAKYTTRAQMQKAAEKGVDLDLLGKGRGALGRVVEETAVESIRQVIAPVKGETGTKAALRTAARAVAGSLIGGDVALEKGVRELSPEVRKALDTGERIIEQHIGDTIGLLRDAVDKGGNKQLSRYLSGAVDVRRRDGRSVLSAGHDSMGSVIGMYQRTLSALDEAQKKALVDLADAINSPNRGIRLANYGFDSEGKEFAKATADQAKNRRIAVQAMDKIMSLAKGSEEDIGVALSGALRNAVDAPGTYRPTHEMRLVETITYLAGMTARPGGVFKGSSEQAVTTLLKDVAAIYDEEAARRVAVLVGSFGAASLGKDALTRMGLGVNAKTRNALINWSVGEQPGLDNINALQFTANRFGANIEFVKDAVLDANLYIPRQARDCIAKALSRASYRPAEAATGADAYALLYRYMKTRMTRGSFFLRQRYFMMNTVDHFVQISMQAGFGVGAMSLTRVLLQDVMVLPAWQQVVDAASRISGGRLVSPNKLERARAGLQEIGDIAAGKIGEWFSLAKYRIEVNPILEGVDGAFRAGGKIYDYRSVRNIAVEEGVFASMSTRELQNAIVREGTMFADSVSGTIKTGSAKGRFMNFLADWQQTVGDTAEAWGERERLGAMVTLMEAGYDPRTAARITVDALYDYSQSLTAADRHWLVGILFPFWAFQKNANQQVVNLMFSPWGAYRMMAIKRARDRSADLLSEILFREVGGEYELDVESMPPELQDSYYAIVKAFEDSYDGSPPPEAKRALRMLFRGQARSVEDGKMVELTSRVQEIRMAGGAAGLQRFGAYAVVRPDKASRMSYFRDRAGVAVPFPRTEAVRMYYSMAGDDHSYMELFWPESAVEGGLKHITQISAAYLLLSAGLADQLPGVDLTEGGMREVSYKRVLEPAFDITRSPILAPILADATEDLVAPKKVSTFASEGVAAVLRVHPWIGAQLDEAYGTTFIRVPAQADPFVENPEMLSEEDAERIRRLQAEYPDIAKTRDERYYIPGGAWALAFENSPLGELNQILLRAEETPLERTDIRGELLRWARASAGMDVSLTTAQKAAKYEEPTKLKETTGI
jgi:ribosomal protein S18 acetylase RimI-like enzyme